MNILINHCWCSDSIWGGCYHCRVVVSIYRITEGNDYHDKPDEDWQIIEEPPFPQPIALKQEVIDWLNANVKERKGYEHSQGWAIGTDEYNGNTGISFSVFFHREKDGLAFIKRWSRHKKPTYYCQYFKDVRKKLNLETGKMEDDS